MESHEDREQAVKSSVLTDREPRAHLIIHGLQYLQVRVVDTAVIVQTLREHKNGKGTHGLSTEPNPRKAPVSSCSAGGGHRQCPGKLGANAHFNPVASGF